MSFVVVQQTPAQHPTLRPHRIAVGQYGQYGQAGGALTRIRQPRVEITGERTEVPQFTAISQPDLMVLNDDDTG